MRKQVIRKASFPTAKGPMGRSPAAADRVYKSCKKSCKKSCNSTFPAPVYTSPHRKRCGEAGDRANQTQLDFISVRTLVLAHESFIEHSTSYSSQADASHGVLDLSNVQLDVSSVVRLNISISYPLLERSLVVEKSGTEERTRVERLGTTRITLFSLPQIPRLVHLLPNTSQSEESETSATSDDTLKTHIPPLNPNNAEEPFTTPPHSRKKLQIRRSRSLKTCRNEECKDRCGCRESSGSGVKRSQSHKVTRSRSHKAAVGKPPLPNKNKQHAPKQILDVPNTAVPYENIDEDQFEVPVIETSAVQGVKSGNAPADSESDDEITLKPESHKHKRQNTLERQEDIHKLGTLLLDGLRSTSPSARTDSAYSTGVRTESTEQLRATARTSSVGSRSSCASDYSGRETESGYPSGGSYADMISLPPSSSGFSRATSSDHVLTDFKSPEYYDVASEHYTSACESRNLYTPFTQSEPDTNQVHHNSFQNIIRTISDLEDELGPEKHEDLKFLREILENDKLSTLHMALKKAEKSGLQSQSTPALGAYNVANEGMLRAHDSVAASYYWEEMAPLQNPLAIDEDLVTIRFTKQSNQTLGATIIEDKRTGAIRIKRILEESPIAACNRIHPGDELKRINEIPVAGKTLDEVCDMLGRLTDDCTLTVSTFGAYQDDKDAYTIPKSRYFRAFFNYDPTKDEANPCKDASFSFELGDILEVLNTDDDCWWQAKKYSTTHVGLIPSHEQRLRYLSARPGKSSTIHSPLYKRDSGKKNKRKAKDFLLPFGDKEHKEPLTYIEVTHVRPSRSKRRPIILTGAKGFGGTCIRERIIEQFATKYFTPKKHTTKPKPEASSSVEDDNYNYCTKKEFNGLIKQQDFIHYSKVNGYYYGTSYQSVRDLIVTGRICILDVHPQYLPSLCNGTLRPHVIFIEPTTEKRIKELRQSQITDLPVSQRKINGSSIRELRFNSERLLRRYTEYIDTIITLEGLESASDLINQVTDRIIHHPAWMPRKWLESAT